VYLREGLVATVVLATVGFLFVVDPRVLLQRGILGECLVAQIAMAYIVRLNTLSTINRRAPREGYSE
jgi:hypothetical protein